MSERKQMAEQRMLAPRQGWVKAPARLVSRFYSSLLQDEAVLFQHQGQFILTLMPATKWDAAEIVEND